MLDFTMEELIRLYAAIDNGLDLMEDSRMS